MKVGNVIASAVVLTWGIGVLVYALAGSATHGSGAYQTGQVLGLVFAAVLVFAGGRGLRNELRKRKNPSS